MHQGGFPGSCHKRGLYYEIVDASSSIQGTSLIPIDFGVILTTSFATSTDSVKPLDLYLRESQYEILHGGSSGMTSEQQTNGSRSAASWKQWSQRFDRYYHATQLHQWDRKEQVSIFLYAMGDQVDDLLTVLQIDESEETYTEMKTKLDKHFGVRKNIIVERARFNQRKQQLGKPVDHFIQDLYPIASDCNYGTLKEDLIRDRIVVGVLDDALSEDLQSRPDLTLDVAVRLSQQAEARQESQSLFRDRFNVTVNAVNQSRPRYTSHSSKSSASQYSSYEQSYPHSKKKDVATVVDEGHTHHIFFFFLPYLQYLKKY